MGGSRFSSGNDPLFTPRMPANVYQTVMKRCKDHLLRYYLCVASPIEGPGKKDFGDIDILLSWPKQRFQDRAQALSLIYRTIGATRSVAENVSSISANFAIPWPPELSEYGDKDDNEREKHIQVDVRVCDTLEEMQWMLFKHAHGDMWNILGATIRPYGLTIDDMALWARVPEIEAFNKKQAKVFLSADPVEIVHFLGLPVNGFWEKPYETLEQCFDYATKCRMFWVRPATSEVEELLGRETSSTEDRKRLTSNDRRRMNYRPVFRKWIEEFIPKCREKGLYLENPYTREEITLEALERFHARGIYQRRLHEFLLERQRNEIWNDVIKVLVPQPETVDTKAVLYRSCLVKALKKIILDNDHSYGIAPNEPLSNGKGMYDLNKVKEFIFENQDQIGAEALRQHHQAFVERKERQAAEAGQTRTRDE